MPKKVLIAIDDSKNSMKAVNYVAKGVEKTGTVTLMSVIPDPTAACGLDSPSLTTVFKSNRQTFCAVEDAKKDKVKAFAEKAKATLIKAGFASKNVKIKIHKKKVGIARDILKEARQGKYTTVVVGRRGLSAIKQYFMGSVSNKIVTQAKGVSVIVVD